MFRYFLLGFFLLPATAIAADVSVSGDVTVRDGNNSVSVGYSNRDRTTIDEYYRHHRDSRYEERRDRDDEHEDDAEGRGRGHGHGGGIPPGLARRGGDLPPGLAKRHGGLPPGLVRNERLPRDVEYEPLPRGLERRLPPLPSRDYIRVRVGSDFLILNKKTHVVIDLVRGLGG